ncbi:NUDIX domain-containing protein [Candidatus Woesearchaeota archaeon]|jgi:8-oxo-dGTP diphosphatase|nr:NUDIX domain-containing protein [Candidatus Woesearchaeota archaeon]MBT4368476.1 NUDIX domain-containing protein [Candidatus Woesearchaeota archaeon]MBT4712965.1 NUDIX domain-containing protein [Candidatus Woesearchaeota archaeon]MBT6639877.1 NUDIX domain-containing protein [Candidatus Woesearchaeota archaeon]MBT7134049.1 NUDIX domain-containing protein [Candidatus Woesearchaeota archaeon]
MKQKISVGGMLVKDGKVLVVRRSSVEEVLSGYYELPGGKVEFGDHPEETVVREFKEETGLDVSVIKLFKVFTYVIGENHTVELVYIVSGEGEVVLSEEHDDYKWVSDVNDLQMTEKMKKNIKEGLNLQII